MRLIDADALMPCIPAEEIVSKMAVANAPTIEERKVGKWIHGREIARTMFGDKLMDIDYEGWSCSICGCCEDWRQKPTYNFCPNCGAKMEGNT